MEIPAMAAATAALEQPATVFVAPELSKARWLVGIHSPIADRISRHSVAGGDSRALIELIVWARRQAEARLAGVAVSWSGEVSKRVGCFRPPAALQNKDILAPPGPIGKDFLFDTRAAVRYRCRRHPGTPGERWCSSTRHRSASPPRRCSATVPAMRSISEGVTMRHGGPYRVG